MLLNSKVVCNGLSTAGNLMFKVNAVYHKSLSAACAVCELCFPLSNYGRLYVCLCDVAD